MDGQHAAYAELEQDGLKLQLKDCEVPDAKVRDGEEFGPQAKAGRSELFRKTNGGLEKTADGCPLTQKTIWNDLVRGKPELDDSLSENARLMKSDMYLKTFKNATDLDHVCRIPGSAFLRCLRDNVAGSSAERNSQCATSYAAFDACRKGMLAQQREATNDALVAQQVGDHRAKALFERYCIMQDTN